MVAYDNNAEESQYLQGWLMHDHFTLRGSFGAPYEFLWANPYQPGLTFMHVPLIYHSSSSGHLFVRSSWDDDADWFGYFDGGAQLFRDGKRLSVNLKMPAEPLALGSAVVAWGPGASNLRVSLEDEEAALILIGLNANRAHLVEIDDEEAFEESSDPAGTLILDLPRGKEAGVRVRELGRVQ